MTSSCTKDIVYRLYDERMEKIENNEDYRKYLNLESDMIKFVGSHLSGKLKIEFENSLYEVISTLSYIIFLEGMKANRDLINTLTEKIEEVNLEL